MEIIENPITGFMKFLSEFNSLKFKSTNFKKNSPNVKQVKKIKK